MDIEHTKMHVYRVENVMCFMVITNALTTTPLHKHTTQYI